MPYAMTLACRVDSLIAGPFLSCRRSSSRPASHRLDFEIRPNAHAGFHLGLQSYDVIPADVLLLKGVG